MTLIKVLNSFIERRLSILNYLSVFVIGFLCFNSSLIYGQCPTSGGSISGPSTISACDGGDIAITTIEPADGTGMEVMWAVLLVDPAGNDFFDVSPGTLSQTFTFTSADLVGYSCIEIRQCIRPENTSCAFKESPKLKITIEPCCTPTPIISGPTGLVSGTSGTYTITNPDPAATYTWSNGTVGTTANYTFTNSGENSVAVTATAPGGCTKSSIFTVLVDACTFSPSSIDYDALVCSTFGVDFVSEAPPGSTYQWSFDGGTPSSSTDANPIGIIWDTAGEYTITLIINSNGESCVIEDQLVVNECDCNVPIPLLDVPDPLCMFSGQLNEISIPITNYDPSYNYSISGMQGIFLNGDMVEIQFFTLDPEVLTITADNGECTTSADYPIEPIGVIVSPWSGFGQFCQNGPLESIEYQVCYNNPNAGSEFVTLTFDWGQHALYETTTWVGEVFDGCQIITVDFGTTPQTWTQAGLYDILVSATLSNGCTLNTQLDQWEVHETPELTTVDVTGCAGEELTLSGTSSFTGTSSTSGSFEWVFPTGFTPMSIPESTQGDPGPVMVTATSVPGVYVYYLEHLIEVPILGTFPLECLTSETGLITLTECGPCSVSAVTNPICDSSSGSSIGTLEVEVTWEFLGSNDFIEVIANGVTQTIDATFLMSPQVLSFPIPTDGATGQTVDVAFVEETTCIYTTTYDNPTPCLPCDNIVIQESNLVCNDNGTGNDDTDDFYFIDFIVTADNGSASGWIADDANATTGLYGETVTIGPFNISDGILTLVFTDADDGTCTNTFSMTTAPLPCSTPDCNINLPTITTTCDDNGTNTDPSDDTFSYTITVIGSNTGATYNITGSDMQTGTYGAAETFGPFAISDGDLMLTITDSGDTNCSIMTSVLAPPTCSGTCILNPMIRVECKDNGTPTDDTDDLFEYYILVTGTNTGATYSVNGDNRQTALSYGIEHGPFGMFEISGGDISLIIADVDDSGCTVTESVTPPAPCSGACTLNVPIIEVVCLDNGTPSDSSDDQFEYTINVSGSGVGANYSISGSDTQSGLAYNSVQGPFGPFPISGGDLMISITDASGACMVNASVVAPPECSDQCILMTPMVRVECQDNGTPSDQTDDVYVYYITVMGLGTGATYQTEESNLATNDNFTGLSYNVEEGPFGPYLISDGDLSLLVTDETDLSCTTNVAVLEPAPCSNACQLNMPIISVTCLDNGTPTDDSDDQFEYTIDMSGTNVSLSYTLDGDDFHDGLDYGLSGPFGPFPIAGGSLSITITDDGNANCSLSTMILAPDPCSTSCSINSPMVRSVCDDNGTPLDGTDDVFNYFITTTGLNTSTSYSITIGDTQSGLLYNVEEGPFGPFPIAGGNLGLAIVDSENSSCSNLGVALAPEACSDACLITTPQITVNCLNNGTPFDPSDDMFEYQIEVSGTNTGTSYSISGDDSQPNLGYDILSGPFGPFPISGGDLMISIQDDADNTCMINAAVMAPIPCPDDAPCSIDDVIVSVFCDDNGTNTDDTDDQFYYSLNVTGTATSSTFSISGGDTQSGLLYNSNTTQFGPYAISDGPINITVTDDSNSNCSTMQTITPPDPCSGTCSLNTPDFRAVCDDNGTPAEGADDFFNYYITVTGSTLGSGYNISGGDNQTGLTYGVEQGPFGPFPISTLMNLSIQDVDNQFCITAVRTTPVSSCSNACALNTPMTRTVCNDNMTPSDPSDDYYSYFVIATAINGTTFSISGADNQSGLAYGVEHGPFASLPISGGNVSITLTDDADANCILVENLIAPEPCVAKCALEQPIIRVVCLDNGTPDITADDQFEYYITTDGIGTSSTYNINGSDTQTGLNYGIEQGPFGPFGINSRNLLITISDDSATECEVNAVIMAPAPCSVDCPEYVITTRQICNDNGTASDETDDVYDYYITVGSALTLGTYSISGGDTQSSLSFGVEQGPFGPFAISDGGLILIVTDDLRPSCEYNASIMEPTPCSLIENCSIAVRDISSVCNDNGTSTDNSDDYFEYYISPTIIGGGATYGISGDDTKTGLPYASVQGPFGNFPIVDGSLMLTVFDEETPSCMTNIVIPSPETCSDGCSIIDAMVRVECNDNDTPSDDLDDIYYYYIIGSGVNVGGTYSISGGDTQSDLTYNIEQGPFGPFDISSGGLTLTIVDIDDPGCTLEVPVNSPTSCSTRCSLNTPIVTTICSDNGTPSDETDDVFNYTVNVSGNNIGTTYSITGGDNQNGLQYGLDQGPFGTFPISGGDIMLTIVDDFAGLKCFVNAAAMTPETCSSACVINGARTREVCNDNGTPTDPSDDTYEYYVLAMSTNGSSSYSISGDDSQTSLSYNIEQGPFGPFTILGGNLSLKLADDQFIDCDYTIDITAPATCSVVECVTEEYTICDNGSNSAELFAEDGLTGIQWYNESGILVGETDNMLNVTSATPGMMDGEETFHYTAGIGNNCIGNSCCPIMVKTEVCCVTDDCLGITVNIISNTKN